MFEAERRHLKVTGTLGVLAAAHRRNLWISKSAVARLPQTSFYLSDGLVNKMGQRLADLNQDGENEFDDCEAHGMNRVITYEPCH